MELEKTPTQNHSVNKPQSGTYGEKADLNRLRSSLPSSNGGAPQPQPTPPPMGRPPGSVPPSNTGGRPRQAPGGIPGAVLSPTSRPDVPINTPLAGPTGPVRPLGGAQNAVEARRHVLQQLSRSPEVSDETREWARIVLEMLSD